jgi:hypothetical protein
MPGLLDIRVLGDFRVLRDGVLIELPPSKKTRALLAYLAVTGQSHRRERLCELFWEIPDDPRGALRWSLSKIRQILGRSSECLETDRNAVALKLDGIDLDFARVGTLRRDDLGSRETSDLEGVAALYRGGFLSDLSLPRCPDFEAWRIAIANEVEVGRIRVLQELIRRLADTPERAVLYGHALRSIVSDDVGVTKQVDALSEAARRSVLKPAEIAPEAKSEAETGVHHRKVLSGKQPEVTTPPPAALEETRKQISVLAVEIVTPVHGYDEADPEVFMQAVEPVLDLGTSVIEQRAGTVVHRGQADLTAIFGALSSRAKSRRSLRVNAISTQATTSPVLHKDRRHGL